ncbi:MULTISPECIES: RNA-binding cell elongation regulator Jag/EloR [unclassified Granulicatella]|uniref:RNA-binding cell elongation regulator Jag/EloR n=1 Tax=unclassified Granulicatella TaxID=2630493 RepID=UPI00066BB0CA|nr:MULTISPECIES: RNA-binding cell elongation regulator Jag/EloR [unclassified Granulicatella]
MTNTIKETDTSVEKAIQKGLRQLGLTKEEVVVEVLSEGKKGLFGFGQKDAIVALTPVVKEEVVEEVSTPVVEETVEEVVAAEDESFEEEFEDEEDVEGSENEETTVDRLEEAAHVTKAYLEGIAKTYGAEATVAVEVRRDRMTFVFDTDKQGLLIGKHGKILNALQVLAQVSVHRFVKGRISVQVDVGDYRARRSETLQQIAERTARKVLKTKQPVYLEPLPAYERKQIHAALSKNKRISTHSEGKEPHRYLVVEIAE